MADDNVDEDNNEWQRLSGSLEKGHRHTELMVYMRQHAADIFDSAEFRCKHREEDLSDGEEGDPSCTDACGHSE